MAIVRSLHAPSIANIMTLEAAGSVQTQESLGLDRFMSLIKSKQRTAYHGEGFTLHWLVEEMLDFISGACSSAGTVMVASDLVGQEPRFQDFAIAQELLHLRAPTHGRLFKALMSAAVPGWRELEEQCGMPCLNCERGAS